MKSLLFRDTTPFIEDEACGPGRTEVLINIRKDDRIYRFILRDKVTIEG